MTKWMGLVVIAGLAWLGVSYSGVLDDRPVKRLLFIGHSRTYLNDLPQMVANIASSAGSPVRYSSAMHARGGASLKDHWENPQGRALIRDHVWDHIIIQPSLVQPGDDSSSDFMTYGNLFVSEAAKKSKTSVVVDWPMTDAWYVDHGWDRAGNFIKNEADNWTLARNNGAGLINVARIWDNVRAEPLSFSLYVDQDHPSVEGTYLVALAIAADVADTDLAKVDYVPWGMSSENAALLRQRVRRAVDAS